MPFIFVFFENKKSVSYVKILHCSKEKCFFKPTVVVCDFEIALKKDPVSVFNEGTILAVIFISDEAFG